MRRITRASFIALLLALLVVPLPRAIGIDVVNGYETNWIDPRLDTVFTSSVYPTKAQLTVNAPIFDSSPDASIGRLRIYLNSKQKFLESFYHTRRSIRGPWIFETDEHEPLVAVDVYPLDRPGVSNVGQTTFAYQRDSSKKGFRKIPSPKSSTDAAQAAAKVVTLRRATKSDITAVVTWKSLNLEDSDWTLRIKKGRKTLLSGAMKTADLSSQDRPGWSLPQCYGPYVFSLDGSGEPQVDLRYSLILNKNKGESTYYFERIFYFDRRTKRLKSLTHAWGENNPRLSDLRHDGNRQFITEDWQLQHDAFNDSSGPLQVWQLNKHHRLENVTRQFPEEIKKHAKAIMNRYNGDKPSNEVADHQLLSYYGDLCLMGQRKRVISKLHKTESPGSQDWNAQMLVHLKKYGYL